MGLQLNFRHYRNEGEKVIIVPGLFGMLDNWHSFAKKLSARGYDVYSIDQRDHGKSPHSTIFNYDELSADLLHFCDQNKIDKAHFIGHSLGGKTVMRFSLLHPDRVDTQIVVDMTPKTYPPGHQEIFDALFSLSLDQIHQRKDAEDQLFLKLQNQSVVQFLLKNLTRNKEGGYRWKMNLQLLYDSYENIIKTIADESDYSLVSSLFVRGTNSNYILQKDEDLINTLFPNYQLEEIEAGHWIHAEKPDELLDLIIDFID